MLGAKVVVLEQKAVTDCSGHRVVLYPQTAAIWPTTLHFCWAVMPWHQVFGPVRARVDGQVADVGTAVF